MKKFELIANGCLYEYRYFVNFLNARRHFEHLYSGKYEILDCETGERKNVNFA